MSNDARFWDRTAERYFASPIKDVAAYEEKLRITQDYLRPDMDVLELGCGTGGAAIRHAPHVRGYHAVDISEAMLDIARRQAAEANARNVAFERADVAAYEAPNERYDAVLALSLLHLVEDPEALVARIVRWLKPGGVFVSGTACIADRMPWFGIVAPIGKALGVFPYVNVFSGETLEGFMTGSGLSVERRRRPDKAIALFLVCRKPA